MQETIAALATATGKAGIGVIRISGPLSYHIATCITKKSNLPARQVVYTKFVDKQEQLIDKGILLFFPKPSSFTGEDVIECQLHGSPVVLDMLIAEIINAGARMARPGEFSERAFLNGKIDLLQAEAIADLIEADSITAARLASRSLQGFFSEEIHHLVDLVVHLRIFIEASLDFPEEEIDFLVSQQILKDLEHIKTRLNSLIEKANQGHLIKEGMQLVIVGSPNAGKSSILNALCGNNLAIVTDIPGTTRDLLKHQINIDGMPIHLIDTAGLRESADLVEQEGIKRAYQQIAQADHILWIYDAASDPENQSLTEIELPEGVDITYVRNKIDKIDEDSGYINENELAISAKYERGLDLLKSHLKSIMGFKGTESGEFLARRRHLVALHEAQSFLKNASDIFQTTQALELFAEELRQVQKALNEITGEFSNDDLLGKIFSSFCIGK